MRAGIIFASLVFFFALDCALISNGSHADDEEVYEGDYIIMSKGLGISINLADAYSKAEFNAKNKLAKFLKNKVKSGEWASEYCKVLAKTMTVNSTTEKNKNSSVVIVTVCVYKKYAGYYKNI